MAGPGGGVAGGVGKRALSGRARSNTAQGLYPRRRRAGRVMMEAISSSTPPTAMPTRRKGMRITQTMG